MGHISGQGGSDAAHYFRNFVYQFHVPLFFFLSGYCFKEQDSWKEFLIKKIKRLYLPFVVWNLAFFAIHLIAHGLNGETVVPVDAIKHTIKILCGLAVTPLGGASWFLITLLQSLVLYTVLLALFPKSGRYSRYLPLFTSLLIAFAGMAHPLPYGWDAALVALFFVAAGHMARSFHLAEQLEHRLILPLIVMGLAVVCLCALVNHPDMTNHQYGSIPIYLIASLSGIIATLLTCMLLVRARPLSFLGEWGKITIWILLGHFAAFKLVTIGQIMLFHLPWDTVFTHPCNYVGKGWGVLYFVFGFFLPLLLSKVHYPRLCTRSHS